MDLGGARPGAAARPPDPRFLLQELKSLWTKGLGLQARQQLLVPAPVLQVGLSPLFAQSGSLLLTVNPSVPLNLSPSVPPQSLKVWAISQALNPSSMLSIPSPLPILREPPTAPLLSAGYSLAFSASAGSILPPQSPKSCLHPHPNHPGPPAPSHVPQAGTEA